MAYVALRHLLPIIVLRSDFKFARPLRRTIMHRRWQRQLAVEILMKYFNLSAFNQKLNNSNLWSTLDAMNGIFSESHGILSSFILFCRIMKIAAQTLKLAYYYKTLRYCYKCLNSFAYRQNYLDQTISCVIDTFRKWCDSHFWLMLVTDNDNDS